MAKLYLARLGGGNRELLAEGQPAATTGERGKFAAMGGVLLTTAGVATVSMFFALHHAIGANVGWSIVLGLAWGIVILNLDRFLVVTMNGARDRKLQLAITVLLRLLLAGLVAMVVSMPLVLQIFAGDVTSELPLVAAQKSEHFKDAILNGPIEQRITDLKQQIASEEAVLDGNGSAQEQKDQANVDKLTTQLATAQANEGAANQKVQCEIGGLKQDCPPGTSGIPGDGPRAKADAAALKADQAQVTLLQKQLDAANKALTDDQNVASQNDTTNQTQLTANEKTLTQQQGLLNSDIADDRNKNNADHSLLAQVQALFAASDQSFGLTVAHWLVTLLFFSIELLPVGVKTMMLLGPKSAYEEIAENADQAAIRTSEEKIRERNAAELEIARLEAQAMVDKRRMELEMAQAQLEAEHHIAHEKVGVDKRAEDDMRTREAEIRLWANGYIDKRSRRYIKAMLAAWARMIDEKIKQAYPQQTANGQQNANSQGQYSQQQPNPGYNLPNGGGGVV